MESYLQIIPTEVVIKNILSPIPLFYYCNFRQTCKYWSQNLPTYREIKSKKIARLVAIYEKDPQTIEWFRKIHYEEHLWSFKIPHGCQRSSHAQVDDYFFEAQAMLYFGYTYDKIPLKEFEFRSMVNYRKKWYEKLIQFCYNNIETNNNTQIKKLLTIKKDPIDPLNHYVGFVGLVCLIVLENQNIELFKILLQQEDFKKTISENSGRILQNLLKSKTLNIDIFAQALNTNCFDIIDIGRNGFTCPLKHPACRDYLPNLLQPCFLYNQVLQEKVREYKNAKERLNISTKRNLESAEIEQTTENIKQLTKEQTIIISTTKAFTTITTQRKQNSLFSYFFKPKIIGSFGVISLGLLIYLHYYKRQ